MIFKLRAHHFLCLQTFKGLGYSREFVAAMRQTAVDLRRPGARVILTDSPDSLCEACPHSEPTPDPSSLTLRCSRNGPGSEVAARRMDQTILRRLRPAGGQSGDSVDEVLVRLRGALNGGELGSACSGCGWYGYCEKELDRVAGG